MGAPKANLFCPLTRYINVENTAAIILNKVRFWVHPLISGLSARFRNLSERLSPNFIDTLVDSVTLFLERAPYNAGNSLIGSILSFQ